MASAAELLAMLPLAAVALKRRRELEAQRKTAASAPPMPLLEYIQQAWHVVEPATTFVPGFHIQAIAEHLEAVTRGEIQDLLVTVPPRSSKSLCTSVFWPTWTWTFAPHTRWLCNSYAQSLSVRDALRSRRLIESSWYQERWRHVFALSGDQNVKSRYDNTRGGYRLASSVTGSNTGEGGDFLVADDCTNVLEGESALSREMTTRWWFEVMPSRRNDPKTSARVIIQQRVHEQDIVGEVLRQGGYHHLNLPMEFEPTVLVSGCELLHDRRSTAGELLWPERYGETEVAGLRRELGSYAWSSQYQQSPTPRAGAIVDPNGFRPVPADWKRGDLPTVQYWDLAYSEKTMADHTAAVTLAVDGDDLFVVNVFRAQIAEANLAEVITDHILAIEPDLVGIEEAAFKQTATKQLVQQVRRLAGSWAAHRHVLGVPVSKDKVLRAMVIAGQCQAGQLYADRNAPWWPAFAAELASFPLGSADDQVDACSGALSLALEHLKRRQTLQTLLSQAVTVRHTAVMRGGFAPRA